MKNSPKYRPSLTIEEIKHIKDLAANSIPLCSISISLIAKLNVLIAKVEGGIVTPAYIPAIQKPAIPLVTLESLGAGVEPEADSDPIESESKSESSSFLTVAATVAAISNPISNTISKEDYWEQCYNKYSYNPSSCTAKELEGVLEYKYLNNLMSIEEVKAFESGEL